MFETGNHVQETALRHQRRARIVRPLISISLMRHAPLCTLFTSEDSDFDFAFLGFYDPTKSQDAPESQATVVEPQRFVMERVIQRLSEAF